MTLTLNVNGQTRSVEADPATPLLYVLRNGLGLSGPKYGCGLGQCGACTVQLDGEAVFSCLTPLAVVGERPVVTVEGLGTGEAPSVLQKAFIYEQAAQCGYCIAGMIMRARALLDANPSPSRAEIREAVSAEGGRVSISELPNHSFKHRRIWSIQSFECVFSAYTVILL